MGRSFGFPAGAGGPLEFAASQLDPAIVAAALGVRSFFPTPRQDTTGFAAQIAAASAANGGAFSPSFGGKASVNYDATIPQYRRPLPPPAANSAEAPPSSLDTAYAQQFPFASAPGAPPVGYAKPLRAVVVLSSPFGISGIFNFSQVSRDFINNFYRTKKPCETYKENQHGNTQWLSWPLHLHYFCFSCLIIFGFSLNWYIGFWINVFAEINAPGLLIFRSNKKTFRNPSTPIGFVYSPLWKITHQNPSVLCTPLFEKSPIRTHRFHVLHPSKNPCFWWALISGWASILANTVDILVLSFKMFFIVDFRPRWISRWRLRAASAAWDPVRMAFLSVPV